MNIRSQGTWHTSSMGRMGMGKIWQGLPSLSFFCFYHFGMCFPPTAEKPCSLSHIDVPTNLPAYMPTDTLPTCQLPNPTPNFNQGTPVGESRHVVACHLLDGLGNCLHMSRVDTSQCPFRAAGSAKHQDIQKGVRRLGKDNFCSQNIAPLEQWLWSGMLY